MNKVLKVLANEKLNLWVTSFFVLGLFGLYIAKGMFIWNSSPSEPIGLYRVSALPQQVQSNAEKVQAPIVVGKKYLVAGQVVPKWVRNPTIHKSKFLLKTATGMPGDQVRYVENTNEYLICKKGHCVSVGEPVLIDPVTELVIDRFDPGPTGYELKPGEYWLSATNHPHSLDSRYLGPVKGSNILYEATPVWLKQ